MTFRPEPSRNFDFVTGRLSDTRSNVMFFDLTEDDDDLEERVSQLEEQAVIQGMRR